MIGVPSSKLKRFLRDKPYIIATDEGEAVCYAVGEYLATGIGGAVFMDSNGFANALEPLTSLVIPYKIPIQLIIGLREDCEQHAIMGREMYNILSDLSEYGNIHIKIIQ